MNAKDIMSAGMKRLKSPYRGKHRVCNISRFLWLYIFRKTFLRRLRRSGRNIVLGIPFCTALAFSNVLSSFFVLNFFKSRHAFSISESLAPCREFPCFNEYPTSSYRPVNQYIGQLSNTSEDPVLTIITVTRGPNVTSFSETTKFIKTQSLKAIRWVIVCDHVSDKEKYDIVQSVIDSDDRFFLKNNSGKPGVSYARNVGLDYIRKHPTDYFTFIDDDDQMELNAYEKLIWVLDSNSAASMSLSYSVFYGDDNMTWTRGFHDGQRNLRKFYLTVAVLMRFSITEFTNCTFNEGYNTGMEDWDFYLCVASHGIWGVNVPEFLFWYQRKPPSVRKERWPVLSSIVGDRRRTEIVNRYQFMEGKFPMVALKRSERNDSLSFTAPFKNALGERKGILLIISGDERATFEVYLQLVRAFARRGYSVSVVLTRSFTWSGHQPQATLQRYTHDVFVIPTFLKISDVPRFIKYIIDSRSVTHVLLSHSALAYHALPIIRHLYRRIPVTDIVLQAGTFLVDYQFASLSAKYRAYIDSTVTNLASMKQLLRKGSFGPRRMFIGYTGLNVTMAENCRKSSFGTSKSASDGNNQFNVVIFGETGDATSVALLVQAVCAARQTYARSDDRVRKFEITFFGRLPLKLSQAEFAECSHNVSIHIPMGKTENDIQKRVRNSKAIFMLSDASYPLLLHFALLNGVIPVAIKGSRTSTVLLSGARAGIVIRRPSNTTFGAFITKKQLKGLFCKSCRDSLVRRGVKKAQELTPFDLSADDIVPWVLKGTRHSTTKPNVNDESIPMRIALRNMIKSVGATEEFPGFYRKLQAETFSIK